MNDWFKIDSYKRYQNGLGLWFMFPETKGICDYCGVETKRRRWCSEECCNRAVLEMKIVKGDIKVIRWQLELRDKCACRNCGEITKDWHADHILPVFKGGGACTLDNFQTLCKQCHKEKTLIDITTP